MLFAANTTLMVSKIANFWDLPNRQIAVTLHSETYNPKRKE